MGKITRKCYLCGRKGGADAPYALHSFPKNVDIAAQWREKCNLKASDQVSGLRICTLHFTKEYTLGTKIPNSDCRIKLRSNAVPSFITRKEVEAALKMNRCGPVVNEENMSPNITIGKEDPVDVPMSSTSEMQQEPRSSNAIEDISISATTEISEAPGTSHMPEEPASLGADLETPHTSPRRSEDSGHPPHLRYLGDLSFEHMSSPRRAARTISFIHSIVKSKDRKIQILQTQNRRLHAKIKKLQGLICHLENTDMLSERTSTMLMV